jgi:hypothetical protein
VRLAGYRLIAAGMDRNAPPKGSHILHWLTRLTWTLVFTHMLELSSKVGSALAAIGANDVAGSVLTDAAEVRCTFPKPTHLNYILW